ncbi:hypothetical protein GALMADRAFT_221975 [Galerina marginata CBS 339.88]|uniref:G domain-containing protein n=1 Tax=Galerina marginata (strain CBS 339.88) TaxID=685588 RepID=A0A067TSZ1_GALM3|nr:hypothetical protein GALMADRAFT_221975 [Galerina marginata CBS 339.88]
MGPTASGKSTFISVAMGIEMDIGHTLQSCTTEINLVRLTIPRLAGFSLVLVDTPGFDTKSVSDVFGMISNCLTESYGQNIKLSGILYLHRITDNRMAYTPMKNLRMFKELCGHKALQNVILTTTMWEEEDPGVGAERERDLRNNYWKPMIDRGSVTRRFEKQTQAAAFYVLEPLLEGAVQRHSLLIPDELVKMRLKLSETAAGQALYSELEKLVAKQQGLLRRMRSELQSDIQDMHTLKQEYEELQKSLDSLFDQLRALEVPTGRRLLKTFASVFHTKRRAVGFQGNSKAHAGKENGVPFANDSKTDSEKSQSVIYKERMNLPGREIQGVTRVNEINGPSAEQQSDAFKKEFFVGQETGRNYLAQIGELENHTNIGNLKYDDIMALSGDDIIIAIMGQTGTGKSNLVDHLTGMTGKPGKRAGDTLMSCTSDVCAIRVENHPKYKNRLVVVDTPGFDDSDTNKSDTEILAIIDQWLIELYKSNIFLHGIIYTHRITDIRLSGACCRSLGIFAELCREKDVKNVLFVTTMWDEVLIAETASEEFEREQHLKNEWKSMFERDVCTARFYNTSESAWGIIKTMV